MAKKTKVFRGKEAERVTRDIVRKAKEGKGRLGFTPKKKSGRGK